jgi:hypothetical protein
MRGKVARGMAMLLFCGVVEAAEFPWEIRGDGLAKGSVTNEVPVIFSAVRMELARFKKDLFLTTTLASNTVVGTEPLSSQVNALPRELGAPIAAINGDFFMMTGAAKGDPRGLHIWRGELVSVATGPAAFWQDAKGALRGELVSSRLTIAWRGGGTNLAGLNEQMGTNALVLFTPRMGPLYDLKTNTRSSSVTRTNAFSPVTRTNVARPATVARTNPVAVNTNSFTRTASSNTIPAGGPIRPARGREYILEHTGEGAWLPLRVGQTYQAKVVGSCDGFTNVPDGRMLLSLSPNLVASLPPLKNDTVVTIRAATEPDLSGIPWALGTGPMIARKGKISDVTARMSDQLHPRTAIGWNDKHLFFAVADGRRKGISEGLRLSEMAEFMIALGCDEAINMDGGQSTTLMLNGERIHFPAPGGKHEVANGVVVLRRPTNDEKIPED